jgi:hypothetical protein
MRDAPGMLQIPLRTSQDPWFDRLWVWTRSEEPRISGPRSGQPLSDGLVQRCEFALRLPYPLSSAWLAAVAGGFDLDNWNDTAPVWFYVGPVRSTASSDKPHIAPPGATLHPLSGMPRMTEAEYNAWEPWRNIQRFRTIGEDVPPGLPGVVLE